MNRKIILFVFITAIGCAAQSTCEQLVPKALELYGCIDSLKTFPEQMNQQISGQLAQDQRMTAPEKKQFAQTVIKSIQLERLIRNVQTEVISGCNASEMKSVVEQLNTPLLQKMRGYESASNTPEGAQQLAASLTLPAVKSPSEKRSAIIQGIVTSTGAADAMVNTVVETTRSMLEGMGAPAPTAEQIAEMRSQIQPGAAQQLNQMMLAVYRDASDQELERYAALLNTTPFQHFNQSFGKAMVKGFATETRYAGQALRKMMDEKRALEQNATATGKK